MPFVSRKIFYDKWSYPAPKHTITLINGFSRPCTDFRRLAKTLVCADYEVIVLDNRGAGRSLVTKPFTISDMADDVLKVWEHLEVQSSIVLGISMGGAIAQTLAINHQTLVSALIIVSSSSCESLTHPQSRRYPTTLADAIRKLDRYVSPNFRAKNKPLLVAMAKQLLNASQSRKKNASFQSKALHKLSTRAHLSSITCPTAVIHGADDVIVPPKAAYILATEIPNASLSMIPEAGHLLLIEAPDKFAKEVVEFTRDH